MITFASTKHQESYVTRIADVREKEKVYRSPS